VAEWKAVPFKEKKVSTKGNLEEGKKWYQRVIKRGDWGLGGNLLSKGDGGHNENGGAGKT